MLLEVIALSVGGNRNRVFKKGDQVTDEDFDRFDIDDLIKEGFLKMIEEPKDVKTKAEPAVKKSKGLLAQLQE